MTAIATKIPHKIAELIEEARKNNASDVHILRGGRVGFWIGNSIVLTDEHVDQNDVVDFKNFVLQGSDAEAGEGELRRFGRAIRVVSDPTVGRFRTNIFYASGELNVDARLLERTVPTFETIDIDDTIRDISTIDAGLVYLCGLPDSGKTTVAHSIINEKNVNSRYATNIFTVENPVEYEHTPVHSGITHLHVGVGRDCKTIAEGITTAYRGNARVILVGEYLMDYPTARATVDSLEAGFLVLLNLHSPDPVLAIERLISPFPPDEIARARNVVAHTYAAGLGLRLERDKENKPLILTEVLYGSDAVTMAIQERHTATLRSQMGSRPNHTFEQSIERALTANRITQDKAHEIMDRVYPTYGRQDSNSVA